MLALEGRILRRQIVHDDAQRLTLNPEHGLHRVGVGHHVALPQPFRQFKARRPKADPSVPEVDGLHPFAVGQPVGAVPGQQCVHWRVSVQGQHPVVVQASLPTVVAVHAVVVCQVDFWVVVQGRPGVPKLRVRGGLGHPPTVTLGAVVQFNVPGVDDQAVRTFAQVHHSLVPQRPIHVQQLPSFGRLGPQRLKLAVQCEAVVLVLGLPQRRMGRLNAGQFHGLGSGEEGTGQHTCGGQQGTQGHAARTQHLALSYKCMKAFLANRRSSLSSWSGSSTQQSTGQTAAHCGSSWKPTHSVHFSVTM